MTWIQTFTDQRFDLLEPKPEQVDLLVIAHALSRICRFGGHVRQFYSVAQHSALVAQRVPRPYAIHALLHDAAEAYIGDVTRPLKQVLNSISRNEYRAFEERIEAAIWKRFGIQWTEDAERAIAEADERMLATEATCFFADAVDDWIQKLKPAYQLQIKPLEPVGAQLLFLATYIELTDIGGGAGANPQAAGVDATANGAVTLDLFERIRRELLDESTSLQQYRDARIEVGRLFNAGQLALREASHLQEIIREVLAAPDGKGSA